MAGSGASQDVVIKGSSGEVVSASESGLFVHERSVQIIPRRRYYLSSSEPTILDNVPNVRAILQSSSSNTGNIWIGGIGDNIAVANQGIFIIPGGHYETLIDDLSKISVIATVTNTTLDVLIESSSTSDYDLNTSSPIDVTPPTVSSTSPADGAINVDRGISEIRVTFSEAIDPDTIDSTNFSPSPSISGSYYIDSSNALVAVLAPSATLSASTAYTITISGIKDLSGNTMVGSTNFTFTTAASAPGGDVTPPTVSSTTPSNGATNIEPGNDLTVIMSEKVQSSTVNSTTLVLTKSDGTVIPSTVTLNSSDQKTITIDPSASLEFSTSYTLTIKGGGTDPRIKDIAGNALAADSTVSFTTRAPTYSTIYSVTDDGNSTSMYDSGSGVLRELIKVTGTCTIKDQIITKASFYVKRSGTITAGKKLRCGVFNATNGTLLYEFTTNFEASTISTSKTTLTFYGTTNTYALSLNYGIGLFIDSGTGSSSSNSIKVYRNNSDVYSNAYESQYEASTSVDNNTGHDIAAILYKST